MNPPLQDQKKKIRLQPKPASETEIYADPDSEISSSSQKPIS
jgi:hypothetical protein